MRALRLLLPLILAALAPGAVDAAPTKSLERAQRLRALLVEQKILDGRTLVWAGKTFRLAAGWQVCEAFSGVCFFGAPEGKGPEVVLAVYETAPGDLMVETVDRKRYYKDRSQEAVHYFIAQGATMSTVFRLADSDGKPLFAANGLLTAAGDAAYESALRGELADKPARREARKSAPDDSRKAAAEIARLLKTGHMELGQEDYDCVRKVYKRFSDEELGIKTVVYKQSPRRFLYDDDHDPTVVVIKNFRKTEVCGNSAILPQ